MMKCERDVCVCVYPRPTVCLWCVLGVCGASFICLQTTTALFNICTKNRDGTGGAEEEEGHLGDAAK